MSDEKSLSQTTMWMITGVAVIAAAAPHAFFEPPLLLHMKGQFDAWLGIATWSPAILAGVGLFFGSEFGRNPDDPAPTRTPAERATGLMIALIVTIIAMAAMTVDRWENMAGMRPWTELKTALPMFAGLGLLRAIFFQGFVQQRVLHGVGRSARVIALTALEAAIALPFLISTGPKAAGVIGLVSLEAVLGAVTYEIGYSTRVAMLTRATAAAAFIWFQQAYLL